MHLILDSEPTLAIKKDMSAIEEIRTERVSNGDIQQINEIHCNGNKENIGDVNVICNDDKNKQIISTEIDSIPNLPIDKTLENIKQESSFEAAVKEGTSDLHSPQTNGALTEESNNNGIDEENQIIENDSEEQPKEIKEESSFEDEEDIISIKHENVDAILEITENEPGTAIPEKDEANIEEDLTVPKDDVEVIKEPEAETLTVSETVPDIELKEPMPDVKLEEPESIIEDKKEHLESSNNKDKQLDCSKSGVDTPECNSTEVISSKDAPPVSPPIELKDDMDVEVVDTTKSNKQDTDSPSKEIPSVPISNIIEKPILCKLSNTLDILSDDEEEPPKEEPPKVVDSDEKQCINIEDDDDIMLIDEDANKTETPKPVHISNKEDTPINAEDKNDSETGEKNVDKSFDLFAKTDEKDSTHPEGIKDNSSKIVISEKVADNDINKFSPDLPLLPDDFLKSAKKNLSDMTREDLEEFCILKIVESIVDRSNFSEIKNKLKSVAQGIDEYRKKTMMLTKQNRDLQVVLKSIQEEQKKITPGIPITPLKITRSVGMQVFMEKTGVRRKSLAQLQNSSTSTRQSAKSLPATNPRPQKPPATTPPIPVPRLVPANTPAMKSPNTIPIVNQTTPTKTTTPMPNGIKNPSPSQKAAEKRQHNRIMSVTVDLTDDEPPTKTINNRTSPAPPVRVVPPQSLMASPRQTFPAPGNNPRKVYIPISNQQSIRPGQAIMLKSVPAPGLRPRCPTSQVGRMPSGSVRMNRAPAGRHPAPLPESMKQYQPPNWKALPPAPDLKLSKVENGIVISWKIEGYQEDSYEEIASYQLYAYQETSSPPSTSLWKKIGDVKALPLPMACTLTQFMAGFKYFFAVRAVDIRSRLGPFSLPGSILLLNKL